MLTAPTRPLGGGRPRRIAVGEAVETASQRVVCFGLIKPTQLREPARAAREPPSLVNGTSARRSPASAARNPSRSWNFPAPKESKGEQLPRRVRSKPPTCRSGPATRG